VDTALGFAVWRVAAVRRNGAWFAASCDNPKNSEEKRKMCVSIKFPLPRFMKRFMKKFLKDKKGSGDAIRSGKGVGNAYRLGKGSGKAVRSGKGDGDAYGIAKSSCGFRRERPGDTHHGNAVDESGS